MPPDKEACPLPGTRSKLDGHHATSSPQSLPVVAPQSVVRRRRWEYQMLRRCAVPPPEFGSTEWLDLPEGDVRKVGGVVAAAASWARDRDELPERLALEIAEIRRTQKQLDDTDYAARHQAHRRTAPRRGRSFAERRAAQVAASQPRPGDFTGRGSA